MDRGAERRYRSLLMNLPVGVAFQRIVLDPQGVPVDFVYLEMNDLFAQLVGIEREQAIGQRATQVIPRLEESATDWVSLYGKVALHGEEVRTEFHSTYLNRTFQVTAFSSEPDHFTAIFTDITHLKEVEESLRTARTLLEGKVARQDETLERVRRELDLAANRSQIANEEAQLFRTLLDQASDAVFVLAVPSGTIQDANLQASAMSRLGRDELLGRQVWEILTEFGDERGWHRHVGEVREGRRLSTGHLRNTAGDATPVECSSRLVHGAGCDYLVSVVRNVTERQVREAEQLALVQATHDGYLLVEANGAISQVNDAYCAMTGRTRAEILALPLAALEVEPHAERTAMHLAAIAERGFDRFRALHHHANGHTLHLDASATASGMGRSVRFHFFFRDTTSLKAARLALAQRDEEIARLKTELKHDPDT
jgi:PAS domain S-box-containing protein